MTMATQRVSEISEKKSPLDGHSIVADNRPNRHASANAQETSTMGPAPKWTDEHRLAVYQQLIQRFGPFDRWGGRDRPPGGGGKRAVLAYMDAHIGPMLRTLGLIVKATAIHAQFCWAVTTQDEAKIRPRIGRCGIATSRPLGRPDSLHSPGQVTPGR
jgi:hypothetical protein